MEELPDVWKREHAACEYKAKRQNVFSASRKSFSASEQRPGGGGRTLQAKILAKLCCTELYF
jgi:hypothetical protein